MSPTTWNILFSSKKIEGLFWNSPKKICIAANTRPFMDVSLLHGAIEHLGIEHKIYINNLSCCRKDEIWLQIIKRGNFVRTESSFLQSLNGFCRIIFPSGGKVKWKSGFYYLAKNTGAKIIVIGIDYKKHNIVIDSIIGVNNYSYEEIITYCKRRLGKYSGSNFHLPMRILFGYGCETTQMTTTFIFSCRVGIFIIIIIIIFGTITLTMKTTNNLLYFFPTG